MALHFACTSLARLGQRGQSNQLIPGRRPGSLSRQVTGLAAIHMELSNPAPRLAASVRQTIGAAAMCVLLIRHRPLWNYHQVNVTDRQTVDRFAV